jgi:transmembrane sensor
VENKINIKLLHNFSEGNYSFNDYLKVRQWFEKINDSPDLKKEMEHQWEDLISSRNTGDESLGHIFEKIDYNILLEERKKPQKRKLLNFYRQAAAILLIPLLIFSVWYFFKQPAQTTKAESWVEINAPEGARVEFFLPDSTSGWLNSGSKLKFPTVMGEHRKVELTGEAYLQVKQRNHSDFIVSVPDMDLKVLGTQFNISAYPGDAFSDVVLAEGEVEINGKAGVFNYTLLPNEKITFRRDTKSLDKKRVDASRYSAWKDGYLIIENEPLGQVLGRFERWYNTEIILQDDVLKSYRFKATFKDEPLEEVLRLIALTTPIRYKIENRDIDSKGVYKQKRVLIKLK